MITIEYLIALILIIIASLSGAMMDVIQFRYSNRLPEKWDPKLSWKNKWKFINITDQILIHNSKSYWYYLWLYRPDYIERFIWSSTILVAFTDAWHAFKSIKLHCIFIAMVICLNILWYEKIIAFLIVRILYGVIFEIIFKKF